MSKLNNNDRGVGRVVTSSSSSRGLGDTIAKITNAVGIKPCGGCKKRQKKLNETFPYPRDKR
jgi:hypothetical protein